MSEKRANFDFRSAAVTASETELRLVGAKPVSYLPSTAPPVSYCVSTGPYPSFLRFVIKSIAVLCAFFLIVSLLAGVVMVGLALATDIHLPSLLLILAAPLVGIGCAWLPAIAEARIVRIFVRGRIFNFWSDPSFKPIFVSIESADTYSKFKFLAEDVGVLLVDPRRGCLILECIAFRYFVLANGVTDFSLHPNGRAILLSYQMKGTLLKLAVIPRSLAAEYKRQKAGSNPELFNAMATALGRFPIIRGFPIINGSDG